jgi:hypothetical protein
MSLRALEADQVKWTLLSICSSTGAVPDARRLRPLAPVLGSFFDRTLDRDAAT